MWDGVVVVVGLCVERVDVEVDMPWGSGLMMDGVEWSLLWDLGWHFYTRSIMIEWGVDKCCLGCA